MSTRENIRLIARAPYAMKFCIEIKFLSLNDAYKNE